MFEKLKAWNELLKLGNISYIRKDINSFFKGNILNALQQDTFFDVLAIPQSLEELAVTLNYTDLDFLQYLLDILVADNVLVFNNGKYHSMKQIKFSRKIPIVFTESIVDIWETHANFIPERLRGNFLDFSGGFNLFNWDDALTSKMYNQIRKSAFAYSNALQRTGQFLDVGSGNGYGTAAIWSYYYANGKIGANKIHITGMDTDSNLLDIARHEFTTMVNKHIHISEFPDNIPKFILGSVENIPFPDNSFDVVYASQVLHWTDAKIALQEMIRVTKPNGLIFLTQNLYPVANPYNELHFKVVKGAGGFFTKNELYTWVNDIGVKHISTATPISIVKIIK